MAATTVQYTASNIDIYLDNTSSKVGPGSAQLGQDGMLSIFKAQDKLLIAVHVRRIEQLYSPVDNEVCFILIFKI